MRKFKYIFVFFVLFVCNFVILKAEENFELECKYKSPYGGKDIVIVGTNYTNDYISNFQGSKGKGIFIKVGGSFSDKIVVHEKIKVHGKDELQRLNGSYLMDFDGRKWVFADDTKNVIKFVGSDKELDSSYKCVDLYYSEPSYGNTGGKAIKLTSQCTGKNCKKLELLTTDIYEINPPTREVVSTCSYNFDGIRLNKEEVNMTINFKSYDDGSLYYNFDGLNDRLVDFNKDYPINTTHTINGYLRNFLFTRGQINSMVRMDDSYKLKCSSHVVGCFGEGGIFHQFTTQEEMENSGLCKDNAGSVSIGDSEGADIEDTLGNIGDLLKPDVMQETGKCEDYLGLAKTEGSIANLLDKIFFVIKVGSIILVIILSMLDFASSTIKSKDELMISVKKLVTRLIILLILLMLPTFIDILGNMLGKENILCGIK